MGVGIWANMDSIQGLIRTATYIRLSVCMGAGAVLLLASASVLRAQLVWDGGTGNWATPTNWNPDFVPTNALSAFINNGGTAQISAASFANGLYLGLGAGQSGHLEIGTGGSLVVTAG